MNILVIDDDPAMTELLKILLQATSAHVIAAHSGVEGIALTRQLKPEIVVLDLMMPEMDGWQVCTSIREFSEVPILVLSALDHPGMVAAALDAGADDYLIKPVSSGMLIAHLQNLLKRTHSLQNLTAVTSAVI